jgi:HPt (histidine-containing phosphotransfer) domain-containing protein
MYSTLAADPDLAELVSLFVQEAPQRMALLIEQFEQQNWERLGRTAHQFKGAAGSYGFHLLTPYAARLESAVRSGAPREQIEQALQDLIDLCGCLRPGLPLEGRPCGS